jgi:hypothetical protein
MVCLPEAIYDLLSDSQKRGKRPVSYTYNSLSAMPLSFQAASPRDRPVMDKSLRIDQIIK